MSASMPALFLSGDRDELVPPAHMQELYQKCPSTSKEWHSFPGATHSAYSLTDDTCVQPKYFDAIAAFLLKYAS